MSAPGPPGPQPSFASIPDPSAPRTQQQMLRPPPNGGLFPGEYPRHPGPPFPNFGPPPGYRGPVRPSGPPFPPPGAAPPQRGPPSTRPFSPPNGAPPPRGPPPPSFRGPPFAGQPPPLQGGPGQARPIAVGPNQFQRPMQNQGAGAVNGLPMQRPPGGPMGQPPAGQPGGQFGQPPPGTRPPPLMSPPSQQPSLQPPRGPPPPFNQPRPGPPPLATSGPPPQRPPPQQTSQPPRPFPPGLPPNFRPPAGWAPPMQRGPVPQQGAPPQGFVPGGRPPMLWPPGPPPGMRPQGPGSSTSGSLPPQQQGPDPTAQGGPPVLGAADGGDNLQAAEGGAARPNEGGGKEGEVKVAVEKQTEERAQSEEVRKAWSAHKNDEGVAYYYNSVTGQSTYEKPEGFDGEEVEIVPVAWERIEGTDWHLVTTNQDSKYYYNTNTQETSWKVPAAVAEQRQKEAEASAAAEKLDGATAVGAVKKKLHEEDANAEVGTKEPTEPDAKGDEQRNGPEQKSNEKEQRAAAFKEMLKEKKVPPFAKWDKELPKIFADPRFKAIATTAERRALFDRYVKTRAEEERLEKREALRAAMGGFRELLDEAAEELDHTVTYADFETMKGDDPRFQALDKKEREALLNERIAPLRKAEAERVRLEHEAAVTAFHELLAERGVNESTTWVKIKEELREDPRYQAVARAEREQAFNDFLAKWNKPAEVEDKLKVHEREARKRKEREEEELERIRSKARQKDALDNFKGILTQRVKEADATWADWRRCIEKEAEEKEVTRVLDAKDQEQLFKEHVRSILDGCVREYKRLLAESLPEDTIQDEDPDGRIPLDSWTAAKGLMREDPRFKRLPKSERELLYRQYTDDVRKRLNLPPAAAFRRDKGPGRARPEAAEPRRESYREHRDKRMRR